VIEGQAKWVGGTLTYGESGNEAGFWEVYLEWPQRPLFNRKYDALGFYEHLQETGTDVWAAFPRMWAAGSNNLAIFKAAGADREDFYDSWASSVLRDPGRGPAWYTDGSPGAPAASRYSPSVIGISDGMEVGLSAPFVTNDIYQFNVAADLVHIQVEGHGRLNDGAIDTTDLADVWYCIDGHPCQPQCSGDGDAPTIAGTIKESFALATSGALDGTLATVSAKKVEDACSTPEPSPTQTSEFCQQYRDLLIWWKANPVSEPNKPWATHIYQSALAMQAVAPVEVAGSVQVVVDAYGAYVNNPDPRDIPAAGWPASKLFDAGTAMDKYCDVHRDPSGYIADGG
jgi:hypothetical protein